MKNVYLVNNEYIGLQVLHVRVESKKKPSTSFISNEMSTFYEMNHFIASKIMPLLEMVTHMQLFRHKQFKHFVQNLQCVKHNPLGYGKKINFCNITHLN